MADKGAGTSGDSLGGPEKPVKNRWSTKPVFISTNDGWGFRSVQLLVNLGIWIAIRSYSQMSSATGGGGTWHSGEFGGCHRLSCIPSLRVYCTWYSCSGWKCRQL